MRTISTIVLFLFAISVYGQPRDLKIAYNVLYDTATGDYEIFVMNSDGSDKKNISNHKGLDWVYYAHGYKLYFVSDRDTASGKYQLFEMDADGNDVRKLSAWVVDDSFLSARRNGSEFIITSGKDGKRAFYIIDAKGSELQRIAPQGLEAFSDPMFLPDEKQIVFRGSKKSPFKTRKGNDPVSNDELYIMNDDGSGLKQLTIYPPGDTTAQWHSYHAGPPRWNPKDKFISYISFQQGKHALYGIRPDGSKSFRWFEDPEPGWHDWTTDGEWVVVDISGKSGYDIYLMNYKTKGLTRLTDDWRYEQCPVFVKTEKK